MMARLLLALGFVVPLLMLVRGARAAEANPAEAEAAAGKATHANPGNGKLAAGDDAAGGDAAGDDAAGGDAAGDDAAGDDAAGDDAAGDDATGDDATGDDATGGQPHRGIQWQERWPRFRVSEYVTTGVMAAGVGVGLFAVPQRLDGWRGGILLDDALRQRIVLGNINDRSTAVAVGDAIYYSLIAYPFVVDVGIAALAVHRSPDVAWQMFTIDVQSFALSGLVSTFTQKLIARVRPYADRCAADPNYDPDCAEPATTSQSTISGHTAMAFTGAGLICAHNRHLNLYGSPGAGVIACSSALMGAVTVGVSRLIADRHYVSDVLAGAVVGISSGLLLPELLHYGFDASILSLRTRDLSITMAPYAEPTGAGLSIVGTQ